MLKPKRVNWFLWVVCVSLVLSSCSDLLYVKDGATKTEFEADRAQCERGAEFVAGYGAATQPRNMGSAMMQGQVLLDECLREKGWRLETAEGTAARASKK